MPDPLPQEFPRALALLRLEDVLPDLPDGARQPFAAAFEHRRLDPLDPRGLLLVGPGGLRPLMALMRLVVLRFRDLNLERFEQRGSEGKLLTAYVRGENLTAPLPVRAAALFIERADRCTETLAEPIGGLSNPVFATWEGEPCGPIWNALGARSLTLAMAHPRSP